MDRQWIPSRLRDPLARLVATCEDSPAIAAAGAIPGVHGSFLFVTPGWIHGHAG